MRPELTSFQIELEKGIARACEHLGKPVVGQRIAGTSEICITGSISDPDMTFSIYPDRAAFQVGNHYQALERSDYEALADLGCKFLEELVKAVQGRGTEPDARGDGGLAGC